jgi:hypothetical protein
MADFKVYNDGLSSITKQLKELNDQANRDASVKGDDARFGQVMSEIQTMRNADGVDEATKAKLDQLKIDVSNLQGLAGSPDQKTKTTNSSWQTWTNDINELIKTMPFNGEGDPLGIAGISEGAKKLDGVKSGNGLNGDAFKFLSDDEAAAAGLKGEVAQVQKQQEVQRITNAVPPVYVSSSNTSPTTYDVFNADGAKINKDPIPENSAIGLNDGKTWLKFNPGGIGHAVPVTADRLKELPSDTHLYDLASLSDSNKQLTERGLNTGGVAPTGSSPGAAPFAGETHTREDNKVGAKSPSITGQGYKTWAGATTRDGQVFADITTRNQDGSGTKYLHLKNEKGEGITPDALNNGEQGIFEFTNGAKYVSTDKGQFLITGEKATNIETGETSTSPADVMKMLDGKSYKTFTQKEQEAGNLETKNREEQAMANVV